MTSNRWAEFDKQFKEDTREIQQAEDSQMDKVSQPIDLDLINNFIPDEQSTELTPTE